MHSLFSVIMAKRVDWDTQSLITTFTLELPDSNQDLYLQVYLDEFYPFLNLPPELRQKIRGDAFPKGRSFYQTRFLVDWPNWCRRQLPRPSISSRISRESRDETLRHYKVLKLPRPSTLPNSKLEFIFWNMICQFINSNNLSLVTSRLAEFDWRWEHFIHSIANLKITCVQSLSNYRFEIDYFETELLKYSELTELQLIDIRKENECQQYGEITGDYLRFFKDLFIKRATSPLGGRKYPMPKLIVSYETLNGA